MKSISHFAKHLTLMAVVLSLVAALFFMVESASERAKSKPRESVVNEIRGLQAEPRIEPTELPVFELAAARQVTKESALASANSQPEEEPSPLGRKLFAPDIMVFSVYPDNPADVYLANIEAALSGDIDSQILVANAMRDCQGAPKS